MKVALITDTHWGARGDSPHFNEFFFKFWDNTFFPYLEKHDIKSIIHLGDVVDRRKFINFATLSAMRTRFFDKITPAYFMWVLVGNHDVPYRNTNEVNAIQELFDRHQNVCIISKPCDIDLYGLKIAMIPWINATNFQETKDFIKSSKAQIAMGHLEISGFEMDRGNICNTGMAREAFLKFETVYTGHFHHRSTDGHIFYLGNTYEITWADYGDARGFHVFDTETREIEFVENPYRMFHKIVYDDRVETLESVTDKDFSQYKDTVIKVVVGWKENPVLFDHFMDAIYKVAPLDVTIVEDFTDYNDLSENDIIDQADSTTDILDKYVESIELGLDKGKMKNIMREIYNEALTQENS